MKNTQLVNLLNRQFHREAGAVLRYLIEAAALNGENHATARTLYSQAINEKLAHAQHLADQIVALGGNPTLTPDTVHPQTNLRQRLRRDAVEERTDEQNYLKFAIEA